MSIFSWHFWFSTTGRLNRASFIAGQVVLLLGTLIGLIALLLFLPEEDPALDLGFILFLIPLLWSWFSLNVKRLHDRDKSGWWLLAFLVPVVGQLFLFVQTYLLPGTPDTNLFGPPPLAKEEKRGTASLSTGVSSSAPPQWPEKRFVPKKSIPFNLFLMLLLSLPLGILFLVVFTEAEFSPLFKVAGICVLLLMDYGFVKFATSFSYAVTATHLVVKAPLGIQYIPLEEIQEVTPNNRGLPIGFKAYTSLDYLTVVSRSRLNTFISPDHEPAFLNTLAERCPQLTRVGSRRLNS